MDLALDITSPCRVRVLLVPVSPIKKSTFWHHVELVRKFNLVRLGDVTPDLHNGANAKFSSQVFQEGQMHFQFITKYNRDHSHLEDFQPHRRIFGVIGIMDCQEWKDQDLSKGYQKFVDMLGKYPTAVATRCFAFDPNENQPDDTKGLIMIPNVGNMSFYMSTMICDFASEILDQFASIAKRIENLKALESPVSSVNGMLPKKFGDMAPQPSSSSPMKQQQRVSQPPAPSPSISSSFLKRASTTAVRNNQKQPPPSPTPSRSSTFSSLTVGGDAGRTKQRTPGRIKKLLADFYLLAGRLPDAIEHYNQAIEMAKSLYDYLWLGSAQEGLACATILMAFLHADGGSIVPRSSTLNGDEEPNNDPRPESKSLVTEVTDMYESVMLNYNKVNSTTTIPMPRVVFAESCLKIARFLMIVYLHGGWQDSILQKIIQSDMTNPVKLNGDRFINTEDLVKCKESGIQRFAIAKWITKIWTIDINDMALIDQINLMTHMSSVLSSLGYHRKAAWFMYETLDRMMPLLIQGRAALTGSNAKRIFGKGDDGILDVLKRICEVYGIGEQNVQDGGTLQMMQNRVDNADKKSQSKKSGSFNKIGFGWAVLQIDILRECIVISEAIQDHASMLYYTTVLLKNLYQYISKDEQIRLASSIQRIVNINKRSGQVDNNIVNYWGFNIVKAAEPIQPIPRKAIYQHPLLIAKALAASKQGKLNSGDPFIYNPFSKKKNDKPQINLIKDEVCEFKVTLTNPFGFDLEISNIVLSTSGVDFSPVPVAASIPANDSIVLRLMGTPLKTGDLYIRGCIIKITGFAEQEFLIEKQIKEVNSRDDVTQKEEPFRLKYSGLRALQTPKKEETDAAPSEAPLYQTLNVIEDQPLLKIKSTSLLHGAVMLFEGEMTHITIQVENIGNIPVDFLTLSFTDSTTMHPKVINPELPSEEQYEIELYIKGTPVFSWEGSKKEGAQIGKKVHLPPGESTEIQVHIYGKQGCTGGAIHIDYGYLDRVIKDQALEEPQEKEEEELPATLYTRQLYLPIMITVYQNLEPLNWDVLYLRQNMSVPEALALTAREKLEKQSLEWMETAEQPVEELLLMIQQTSDNDDKNPYCLLTLDVRNTWTVPFDLEFTVNNEGEDLLKSIVTIQPTWTKRIVLPVKKLFLSPEKRIEPIPSFDPHKQFVVSQGPKMAPEQERARLQMFWYREQLLERLNAKWRCSATGREGVVHLRSSLRLTPLQLSVLKKQDIEFIVSMSDNVHTVGNRQFECNVNIFVTMNVTILNRQTHPVKLILRIQPVQSYNDGAKEYDLTEKLLLQGVSQVVLPEIPANGEIIHSVPLCFLSRGKFEFLYHVENVHTREMHYDHDWAFVHVLEA